MLSVSNEVVVKTEAEEIHLSSDVLSQVKEEPFTIKSGKYSFKLSLLLYIC